jgi:MFS family permease
MSRDLFFVALSLFTWGMGESAYRFFQPLYLEQLGATPLAIGSILGGVGIAMTIAHIPAGYLADRFGRRIMMWSAWILGVLAGSLMAVAKSLPLFTLGVLLYGITAFVVAPMNSYITAARGSWSVGRAIAFTSAMYNLGSIIGPYLGGLIGELFGYARIYALATLIFLVSTILIFLIKPQPTEGAPSKAGPHRAFNPWFLRFMPILLVANLGMYLAQPLAPNYFQDYHSLSLSQIGTLGAVSSLGSVVLTLGLGSLNPGLGFVLSQFATTFSAMFLWGGVGFPWFAAGFFLMGGFRSARTTSVAYVRNLISTTNMGLAYGIAETVSSGAVILASFLAGYLYERNPVWIFAAAIGITMLSAFTSIGFFQFPKRFASPRTEN